MSDVRYLRVVVEDAPRTRTLLAVEIPYDVRYCAEWSTEQLAHYALDAAHDVRPPAPTTEEDTTA